MYVVESFVFMDAASSRWFCESDGSKRDGECLSRCKDEKSVSDCRAGLVSDAPDKCTFFKNNINSCYFCNVFHASDELVHSKSFFALVLAGLTILMICHSFTRLIPKICTLTGRETYPFLLAIASPRCN